MSHSLEIRPVQPEDMDRMRSFLASRTGYRVEGDRIAYWNVDTGVSFRAVFGTDDAGREHLRFLVNYLRPRFFAFECAQELGALGAHLRLEMRDPQSGSSWQELKPDAFVRSWALANAQGARLVIRTRLASAPSRPVGRLESAAEMLAFVDAYHAMARSMLDLPAAELDRIWRWNASARHRAEQTRRYVPTISLVLENKRVATLAELHEARPTLLPRVDFIAVPRPFSPREVGEHEVSDAEYVNAFRLTEVSHLLSDEQHPQEELPPVMGLGEDVDAESLAAELDELFDCQGTTLPRVPFEAVLDAELIRDEDAVEGSPGAAQPPPIGSTRLGRRLIRSGRGESTLRLEFATTRGRLEDALQRSPHVVQRNDGLQYVNEDTGAHFGFAPGPDSVAVELDLCTSPPLVEELIEFLVASAGDDGLRMRMPEDAHDGVLQPFERTRFWAQWNRRSRTAVFEAVEAARMAGERVFTCAGEALTRIHRWNQRRQRLEQETGLQVPRIAFAQEPDPSWGLGGCTTFVRLNRPEPSLVPRTEQVRLAFVEPEEPPFEEDASGSQHEFSLDWAAFATALDASDGLVLEPLPHHRVASPATLKRMGPAFFDDLGWWLAATEVPFGEVVPSELLDTVHRWEAGICSEPFSPE